MRSGIFYTPIQQIKKAIAGYRFARKISLTAAMACVSLTCFGQPPVSCAAPTITSVNPVSGLPLSLVTITGSNFNTIAASNFVYFGAVQGTVTAATATSLTVTVPYGATFAPVVVENNSCGLLANSQAPFLQTYNNAPYIAGIVNLDPKTDFTTGTSPWSVAIGDIDGDGKPDMVTANYTSGSISVFRNISAAGTITAGSFSAPVSFTTGTSPMNVAIGDVDGDGKPDIVVTNNGSNSVSVFHNNATSGIINTGSLATKVDFTTGGSPEGIAIGDLDGDGKPEIIVANETSNNISVLQNTSGVGTPTFSTKVDFTTGTFATMVALGDIDGDGKTDVAATNYNATTVAVLKNISVPGPITTGSLATHFDFTTGTNPHGLAIADIDGDGKGELIVTNYGSNTISLFKNTATIGTINAGSFATKVDFGTLASGPFSLSVGDIDGDSKPDIAVGYNGGNQVSVYRNMAVGTINPSSLAPEVDFTTGSTPRTVAVGDLDLDGLPDVAVSNYVSSTASVLRNDPLKAITGTMLICQNGPTTTLSEPARGGTWLSGSPSVASVGSTGIVSGLTAGTAVISYIVPGGNVTAIVTVNPAPVAAFTVAPNPVCFGTPSTFSNDAVSIANYAWSFGDASTSTLNNVAHTYTASGTFTTTLTVTHTNGCTAAQTAAVTVNPIPALSSTLTPTGICNSTVFNYSPASAVSGTTFAWSRATVANISNSAASGTDNPGETLVNTGVNPVAVTYVYTLSANGCSNTQNVIVSVNPTPVLTSTLTPGSVCSNSLFSYTPTSATTSTLFIWFRAGVTGISNPATSGGNSVNEVLENTTTSPVVVTYLYTLNINGCTNIQNVVVTVNPAPVLTSTLTPAGICNSTLFSYTPTSATTPMTFTWSRATVAGITNAAASGTDNPNETLVNSSPNPVVVTYVYTLTTSGCNNIQNVTVSVNPTPALTSTLTPGAICNNTLFSYVPTSATTSATFNWNRATTAGISNAAASGSNDPAETLENTSSNPVAVTYVYTLSINGCSNLQNVVVTINPTPVLSSTLTPASVCNNTVFNYTPASLTTGTGFAWSRATVAGISNGAASGTNNPAETLVNTSANPVVVSYVYTLTANACNNIQTVAVSVNPTPALSSGLTAPAICNNTTFNYNPTSATTDATFAWSRATVAGISNAAASGTGNPGETLENTTANPVVVSYSYTVAINGCTNTQTVTVSVNPTPQLSGVLTATPICNNTVFNYNPASATTGATFDWSRATIAGISNAAASGTGNPGETLENTSSSPVAVVYVYTLSINGCTNAQNVTVTVNPTPMLSSVTETATCNNAVFNYTPTSATTPATFSWSRAAVTGISNAAASGADDPAETLVNTTTAPVAVIYVYTITANGCDNVQNVTVTVNPTPTLTSVLSLPAICDSSVFNYTPASATTGTIFTWSRAAVAGIANPTATGADDPAEQLVNTTGAPIGVTYVYTLTANGCSNTQDITVTVNPTPSLTSPLSPPAICDSATFSYTPASDVTGTTFEWSRAAIAGIVNVAASGTNDPAEQLINTTADPIGVIYTYTMTANGCNIIQDVTVTVNPIPVFTSPITALSVCDSAIFNYTPASATPGTAFEWSRAAVAGIANVAATGAGDPAEQLINTTADPVAVTYTYTLTANGCDNVQDVVVTVNPTPLFTSTLTMTPICDSTLFSYTPTGATAGTTFEWSRAAIAGIANPAASGMDDPAEILVNTTPDPIPVVYAYTLTANGCSHTQDVTVIVNPKLALVTTPAVPGWICDNTTFAYVATSLTPGTAITWSRDSVTGITAPSASGIDTVNEVLSNTTPDPIAVTYVNVLTANGCTNIVNIIVTVEPTPMLTTPLTPPAICDSTLFTYMPASATAGTTFLWHRAFIPGILLLSGSGVDSIGETLVSNFTDPTPVTYTYTLTANGCSNVQNVRVVVNPNPRLNSPTTLGICDSLLFHYHPTSATDSTSFAWVRPAVPGIFIVPGSGTGNIDDTLINTTNVNVDMIYSYTLTANGCTDSEHVVVTVHPTPTLNTSPTPEDVCSGMPFTYTPGSNTPGTSYTWSRGASAVILPATGSGSGDISETLTNTATSIQQVIYVVSLTANGCSHNENVFVNVRTQPAAPVISTTSPASVCNNTMNQNFGAATAPVAGETFAWSATGATVISTGTTGQYCIVDFMAPGTAVVTLTATTDSNGCISVASYTVTVGSTASTHPYVIYAGGEFICLENDVTGYQWGYDSKTTLDSTILVGEINQAYVNGSPDTLSNYYWVMTQMGGCTSKAYYNAPLFEVGITNVNNNATEVKVYPNPTSNYVNVDVHSSVGGNISVTVLNMLGQEVSSSPAVKNKAIVDVSKLASGMYIVDCYRDGIKIATAKFIKN